jgi:positive regulator of sigma E activity
MGETTLPKLAGVNNWVIIAAVIALALGMFLLMERYEKKKDGHGTQSKAFPNSVGEHTVIHTH